MKKHTILISLFTVVVVITAFFQYKNVLSIKKETTVTTVRVTQNVLLGEKKFQSISKVNVGSTALQLLSSSHKVVSQGKHKNAFITSIDGRAASTDKREFWAFYVNGKQAQVGAGTYIVKNNDTIEWKIETY